MSLAAGFSETKDRPAFVKFVTIVTEDRAASVQEGRWVGKEEEQVHVTPQGSKDIFKAEVQQWFKDQQQQVELGRLPEEWLSLYKETYKRWKQGQDMPLSGTPIKGWGIIGPAMQEELIRMHVLTVEDLAALNDEGLKRIGMGAVDLKNKAKAWLKQLSDNGGLVMETAALQQANSNMKLQLDTLAAQLEKLKALVPQQPPVAFEPAPETITAADIIEDEKPKRKK